jgi:hypothetical protein
MWDTCSITNRMVIYYDLLDIKKSASPQMWLDNPELAMEVSSWEIHL